MLNDKAHKLIDQNVFNVEEMKIIDKLEYFSEKIAELVYCLRHVDYYHRVSFISKTIDDYLKINRLKNIHSSFIIVELKTIYDTNRNQLSITTFISFIQRMIKEKKIPNILQLTNDFETKVNDIKTKFLIIQKDPKFINNLKEIKNHRNTHIAHKDINPKNPSEIKDLYLNHFYDLVIPVNNIFYDIIELFGFNDDIKKETKSAIEMEVYNKLKTI